MSLFLDPSNVHIWYRVTDALDDRAVAASISLLSADERARHDRFVFARDRRDFAEAHALTRRALSLYGSVVPADWTFDVAPGGKPGLPRELAGSPPLVFNLSHTHGLVGCAVARGGEVGFDVELIERAVDVQGIAKRFFTPAECADIDGCAGTERPLRFIELWTLKEAYIKAVGRGLSHPLDEFGFTFGEEHEIRFTAPDGADAGQWTFALFAPSPGSRMAVAVQSDAAARAPARPCVIARQFDQRFRLAPVRWSSPPADR